MSVAEPEHQEPQHQEPVPSEPEPAQAPEQPEPVPSEPVPSEPEPEHPGQLRTEPEWQESLEQLQRLDHLERTCVMTIATLEVSLPDTNPQLTLQEMDSPFRQLRIPIGQAEGVAIAYARRQIPTPRPLSHELFAGIMEATGLLLEVVRITGVDGASFSGEIVVSGPNGQHTFPCRVSDAIALSLRQRVRAPIVATEAVLQKANEVNEVNDELD